VGRIEAVSKARNASQENFMNRLTCGISIALLCLAPVSTRAQPASGENSSGEAGALEEVVVTAQRRTENLQDLAISVTAITGDQLEGKGVDRLADLQFASPSLSITDRGETYAINIRGIGLASNLPQASNGVALYVDGLFQPQIVTAVPFYDISTVEVLRGPQGTFVGNNSTGGAVLINSNDPTAEQFEGYGKFGLGNYGLVEGEGAVNVPLSEVFSFRVAGIYRDRDSYYTDVGPYNNQAGKLEETGGRLGMLWTPGQFSAQLKLQAHNRETGGFANRPAEGTVFAPFRVGDERTLSYDAPTRQEEDSFQAALQLDYEFQSGITLRSLSGYQDKSNEYYQDADATQVPLSPVGGFEVDYLAEEKKFSQELNLISPTDGKLNWIVGGYYQVTDIVVDYVQTSPPPSVAFYPRQDNDVVGLFAHGRYRMLETVELEFGARYSSYDGSGTGSVLVGEGFPGFPPGGLVVGDLSGTHDDSRVTGKLGVNWFLDDDNLLYGFVARGYKPGGFNTTTSEFSPETVLDYELGWKTTMADGRLRMQADVFYSDYQDFQFDIMEPSTGVTAIDNVGSATIKGFELQLQGRFGNFGFDAGAGYVDSDLDGATFINVTQLPPGQLGSQCPPGVPSTPPFCFDYQPFYITTDGGPNLYSPEWTFNAGVEYSIPIGGAMLTPRLNYGYMGSQWTYLAYGPYDRISSRELLSGLLTLDLGQWFVEAWGTNLTDEVYVSGRSGDNEFYGAPREYGLRVGVSF
jgi:iron complex outermembrane receptor protein